ncbi:acetolactate synthase, large subunit, biosynthetic type [Listeria newyorkensis]|uniref:Acetolactate synthase n=1 Tax=Listeria newyorkensis TaxID=1497681 RepID=A0ABX4XLU8_9LIST|nr:MULTISPECIES: biosynthetic-type acetolactate synthase large subunit [Listeria]PNP91137.1 acetolactate synthase, large subunit, biosynthetic type [Listeria newyorkensis]RQW68505.1 biosynthetic-type acetolactate synthase large subunit [Listeria sp. SHR_NRA_18]WAO21523.1 biosynthetic-type acetolactate synthase large subunit [Listeria newyorkensis]SQC58889.1 Acetolactate synthase large subunit [Listeria newyorkensis]
MIKVEKETTTKSGAELLIDALNAQNVEMIFGYPGGAVLPLYDAFYDCDIPHILTRHEQGAVHAAEGYARVTGKAGVVVVTSGPGATNALTGIADAMSDSIPMVVFTGQVATPGIGKDAFQEADMIGLTIPITKYNYQVRDVKDIPKIIKEAFHIATTGRQGPVVIDLPKDMSIATTDKVNDDTIHLPGYQPTVKPNGMQLEKLMQALAVSSKPVILAGAGVNHSRATAELLDFAERYQIPVVNTLLGLGSFPQDHPLFLGMGGMHGSYAANMALTDPDLLINFGSRFDDRMVGSPQEFAKHAVIAHIDIDPAEIGKVLTTKIPIVADIKETLTQLLEMTVTEEADKTHWYKLNMTRKERHPFTYNRDSKAEIKPQKVIEIIGEITEGKALVATDVGQHQMWVAQFYPFRHDHQIMTSGGLGTMGFGFPAAIGAQLAYPEQTVVAFVGDGGFQMTNQELAILNDYNINLKTVIINNGSLGMVRQWQEKFHNERFSHSIFQSQPDFVKLAEAYGVKGVRLTDPETLAADLEEAFAYPGPIVIDCVVSPNELVLPMIPPGKANHQMEGVE